MLKGILILELFGEDVREIFKIYRGVFSVCGGEMGEAIFDSALGVPARSSWVAEITGTDPKYGLARSFLPCKIDYSKSNSKGSRGLFADFILSQGKIYEVKSQVTQTRFERYFCTVDENGDIIKLDSDEVYRSFGLLTEAEREEKKRLKVSEITGPDEQYGLARTFLEYRPGVGYEMQPGKIYEVHRRVKAERWKVCYVEITEDGTERQIDEESAYHAVGALTRQERWEKKRAEKLSRNQRSGGG